VQRERAPRNEYAHLLRCAREVCTADPGSPKGKRDFGGPGAAAHRGSSSCARPQSSGRACH